MRLRRKRMLELMALKKLKQSDLAKLLGCHISLISHVLKGRRRFNLKHSKKLIETFGADLMSRIIDWDGMGINSPFEGVR